MRNASLQAKIAACAVGALFCGALFTRASRYERVTARWADDAVMRKARQGACSALLQDGRVLIAGGTSQGAAIDDVEIYDGSGAFQAAASMQSARTQHACAALPDGRILAAGGRTTGDALTNLAEIYDPARDQWSAAAFMTAGRAGATATVLPGGSILIAGGDGSGAPLATLEVFDPASASFTAVPGAMSSPRSGHAAAALKDGRVLIAGGFNGETALQTLEIYDPATGNIDAAGQMSVPRAGLSATRLRDGRVLLAGGSNGTQEIASADLFDPQTGKVTPAGNMGAARRNHLAFLLPDNNSVLIVGGTAGGALVPTAELFVPWQGGFKPTNPPAHPLLGATGTPLKDSGTLLVAGGGTASAAASTSQAYPYATITTDKSDYLPGNTALISGSGWPASKSVALQLIENPDIDNDSPINWSVTTDANGAFSTTFLINTADLGVTFTLTGTTPDPSDPTGVATVTAMTTFTDGSVTAAPIATDKSDCSTASASFTYGDTVCAKAGPVTVNGNGPNGSFHIQWIDPTATVVRDANENVSDTFTVTDSFAVTKAGSWTVQTCKGGASGPPFTACSGGSLLASASFTVSKATPTFSSLTGGTTTYGSVALTTLSGTIKSGSLIPSGNVSITVNGVTQMTAINATTGNFSSSFDTHTWNANTPTGYTITYSYAGDSNFNGAGPDTGKTLVVNQAPLTITASSATMTYGDPVPTITPSYTGFVNGQDSTGLSTQPTCTTTYTTTSAAGSSPSTSCSGAVASNYAIGYVNGTVTVNKATLTITASSPTVTYGDPAPAIAPSFMGFKNGETNAVLTTQPTCTAAYTPTSVAGSSPSTSCSSAVASNYTFSYVNGSVTVNQATLTITASSPTVTYGDPVPAITPTFMGFKNSETSAVLSTQPTCTTAYTPTSAAGSSPSTSCSGAAATNYTFSYVNGSVTVNKATLTITATSPTVTYGDPSPAIAPSFMGFKNSETSSVLSTQPTCTTAYTPTSAAGSSPSTSCSGAAATNYTFSYVDGSVTVNKATLTITASSPTVTYGDPAPAITPSFAGFKNGETSAVLSTQPTCTTAYTAASAAGSAPSTSCSGAAASNYTFSYVSGSVTVSKATLTITASSPTVTYGDPVPTIAPSFMGFKNSETSAVLTAQPACTTAYTPTSNAGSSPSTSCSGAAAANYTFSYVNGSVTVNKANQTITFGALANKMLGDLDFMISAAASSGLPVTFSSSTMSVCTLSGSTVHIVAPGTCTISADQGGNINYNPAATVMQSFTVGKYAIAACPSAGCGLDGSGHLKPGGSLSITNTAVYQGSVTATVILSPVSVSGLPLLKLAGGDPTTAKFTLYLRSVDMGGNPISAPVPFGAATTATQITDGTGTYYQAVITANLPASVDPNTYEAFVYGDDGASGAGAGADVGYTMVDTTDFAYPTLISNVLTVTKATPSFSNLTGGTTTYGAAALITLGGTIKAGSLIPSGSVSIMVNGVTQTAAINGATGNFSSSFDTHTWNANTPAGYTISYSYAGDTDFSAAGPETSQSLVVNKAPLTITANNQTKAYGAALPTLTASYSGFVNSDSPASLTTQPTVTTTATAASHVSGNPYAITASGAVSANYAISYVPGTWTITPVALTITADDKSKIYGAPLPALTASYTGFVNGDSSASLATAPTLSTTATASSHVAGNPYPITASGAVDTDYNISYVAGKLTVTAAPLTITADNKTKAYGAPLPALTASYSGFVNGDTSASLTTQPTLSTTATAASHVPGSPYSITATGAVDSDYTITYVAGALTVTPVPLTITADNQTKPYGATLPTLTASYAGLVNGDTPATFSTAPNTLPSVTTTATAASHVAGSPYPITPTGAVDADYTISYIAGTLAVTPVGLTITADNKSKVYGAPLPMLTTSYSGLVNGDTSASLTTPPALSTTATASSHVAGNPYPITASGAVDTDYTIAYVAGSLTVTPAPLTITADSKSKAYGASLPALTASYSGFVNGDTSASLTTQPTLSTTATVASHVAQSPYSIAASGALDSDYTFSYVAGALTVTPVPLTITANNQTKPYGAPLPTLTASYSGFVNGDTAASLTTPPAVTTTATGSSHVLGSPYSISPSAAVDADYTISYVAGTLTVTPVGLNIKADDKTKAYGAPLPMLTVTYTGLVNGDTPATFSAAPNAAPSITTTATPSSHVAGSPYSITASGAADTDYTISYTAGTLTVTAATLTITADDKSKAYGAPLPALTASYSGFVNGDTSASLATQPTLSTTATAASHVAGNPYSITASGAADSDYAISYVAGALTVTPVPLTITANDQTKLYGAALPALTVSYSGFVNGDTSASLTTPPMVTSSATAASHVAGNPYSIAPSGAVDPDYAISYVAGRLTVTPVGLNIKADDKTKVYGAPLPMLTATYTGLVNGDTPATFITAPNTVPSITTTATVFSPVPGPYPITASGAVDSDYSISYVGGSLTVNPASLTITANSISKVYGQVVTFAGTEFTTSGLLNSDKVTSVMLTSAGTTAGATVASSPYDVVPSAAVGSGLGNYTISYVNGKLTVNPAPTTTALSSSLSNSIAPVNITFTATVSSTVTPLGTVKFTDTSTSTVLGTPSLANGQATVSTTSAILGPGTHVISATYNPGNNPNFVTSTSALNSGPIAAITGPSSGTISPVNTPVSFTGTFTDPDTASPSAQFSFDSAGSVAGALSGGNITASYSFGAAGVYNVMLTFNDGLGGINISTVVNAVNAPTGLTAQVVAYDPNAGFVTGGGWINSPAGAYVAYPSLTGKASFGFVSKYQKGANVPTGETEFNYQVANFDFHSTSYQWLVVSGSMAQYKGTGTINGSGNYNFLLTALDGALLGSNTLDGFRIKITDSNNGVIYDNKIGSTDDITANNTQAIGGGSIVIHTK